MKHILFTILFLTLATSAYAQSSLLNQPSWVSEIRSSDNKSMELKSNRTYYVEDGNVIEMMTLDNAEVRIYNIYDFENKIVYHKTNSNSLGMEVSPFSALGARIDRIRDYGCYIAKDAASGLGGGENPRASFYNDNCKQ